MPRSSDILAAINQQHGTAFALLDRYATGEQGAYALADAFGDRFVLKWAVRLRRVVPLASGRRFCAASPSDAR